MGELIDETSSVATNVVGHVDSASVLHFSVPRHHSSDPCAKFVRICQAMIQEAHDTHVYGGNSSLEFSLGQIVICIIVQAQGCPCHSSTIQIWTYGRSSSPKHRLGLSAPLLLCGAWVLRLYWGQFGPKPALLHANSSCIRAITDKVLECNNHLACGDEGRNKHCEMPNGAI